MRDLPAGVQRDEDAGAAGESHQRAVPILRSAREPLQGVLRVPQETRGLRREVPGATCSRSLTASPARTDRAPLATGGDGCWWSRRSSWEWWRDETPVSLLRLPALPSLGGVDPLPRRRAYRSRMPVRGHVASGGRMTPALLTAVALATLPGARVPRDLVAAVCAAEGCRAQVSHHGAVGLMQVVPRWWTGSGKACAGLDLWEPWENVECGVRVLASCLRRCGDWPRALGAFNSGACRENGYARRIMDKWRKAARKATT